MSLNNLAYLALQSKTFYAYCSTIGEKQSSFVQHIKWVPWGCMSYERGKYELFWYS
jgi:hypothetical protein